MIVVIMIMIARPPRRRNRGFYLVAGGSCVGIEFERSQLTFPAFTYLFSCFVQQQSGGCSVCFPVCCPPWTSVLPRTQLCGGSLRRTLECFTVLISPAVALERLREFPARAEDLS